MSYQALARVYRPKNFTELVGQEHVSQALINGLDQDRIHHAFLFTGTRGVGKTTIARILAKALNCEKGVSGHPCGECSSCQEISEGRFVDLVEVDAASRTGVDDTRELLENVQYAPTKGRYKIYLIDEVHMFSNSSFNALLKTLEEPPPHVKFLLATTEPKKLPITVLSRCLQFNLKRLSLPQIHNHLVKLLNLQSVEFEENALELIARAADGSMRDGLSLLDQSLAFGAGKILIRDVKKMLGTMDQQSVVGVLNHVVDKDSQKLNEQLQNIFSMSPDYGRFLDEMALLLHEISLVQILNNYVDNSPFDRQIIKNLVQKTTPEQIQLYYQIVIKGQEEIHLAPDSKTGFEMTIIRLFAFKIGSPVENKSTTPEVKVQISNPPPEKTHQGNNNTHSAQRQMPSQALPVEQPTVSQPAKTNHFPLKDINNDTWQRLFEQLEIKGPCRELARNAHVVSNENNVLVLSIDKLGHAFMTNNAQKLLQLSLENITKEQISLNFEQSTDAFNTIAKTEQVRHNTHIEKTKQQVNENPFVQHMQENFDAQLIQIKKGESFIQ